MRHRERPWGLRAVWVWQTGVFSPVDAMSARTTTSAGPAAQGAPEGDESIPGLGELAAASSFLSSRWSRDNLVTSHPGRLYDGPVLERIEPEALEYLLQDLVNQRGALRVASARMGVFTWDIACESESGKFALQVPRALDEPGRRGRAKRDVPRLNVENARHFLARGLTRFVVEPEGPVTLGGHVPGAIFRALPEHYPVTFGAGALEVRCPDGWLIALGSSGTAELLAEMIAALVYHYEPEVDGGTALTDVFVNDGDFAVKRRADGAFDVRLTAARRREPGIGTNLLLLYLVQLMAYEDFSVDGGLTGLPVLVSNPSVTFAGVVRGRRYRACDLGRDEAEGTREALAWIRDFGRSPEGRAYRPWVERFLDGRLPPRFGDDPREHWWRLYPQLRKLNLVELRARADPSSSAADSTRHLKGFLERLSREIGRLPEDDARLLRINELGREGIVQVLADAQVEASLRNEVTDAILSHWPYRNLEQLLARVPAARTLRRFKSRLAFGRVISAADAGTLKALGPAPKQRVARAIANREIFGALAVPASLHAEATRCFPTFEAYMDAALHDAKWGYYAHRVVIGSQGHFQTHPEELSPDYGRWIATWAFKAWRDLLAHGELSEADPFPLVEFGAGNGRLARDVVDAVASLAAQPESAGSDAWRTFAARLEYRIYEMSASLREKQRELLGEKAVVSAGDARRPDETLKRDFPTGLRGFVVTNEVPDAFGVHKVVLTAEGHAFAALVVPRVEVTLREALGAELSLRVDAADRAIRQTFGFAANATESYLDAATFSSVMEALAELTAPEREARLAGLWFEETYVRAAAIPELAAHLAANAAQYATVLAAEGSGVVLYVNVHADGFMRGLGSALAAGFVVTIDYGDSTWALVQGVRRGDFPFRVYGEWKEYVPRLNDPYFAPGTQDLTADVNFTDLARAGQDAGLKLIHFGLERDLVGDALPELVRASSGREALEKFLGNPGFRVLVLGTRPSEAFSSRLALPLPLTCREQDVSKLQREKIPSIEKRLTEGFRKRD
jgi:SAM-dependent MidA family methyltransferase